MTQPQRKPFLYVVVCAAGIADDVGRLITAAHGRNWDVGVIATPHALPFLDVPAVETQTGFQIRSAWRAPGDDRPLPPADAIVVAPATFNTVNKWAAGFADNLALAVLCEAYGMDIPTVVLPYVNSALAAHPAYRRSLAELREMGVLVGGYEPHRPKAGGGADRFRWEEGLDLLSCSVSRVGDVRPPRRGAL
ncbi:flavoprotein [Streptomyces sp. NPDC002044]|uniref:flavoprotein n=1 Tax=Streptomyces sp. NPDC002044 TaxID=3154662 RepID=UPI00331EBCCF